MKVILAGYSKTGTKTMCQVFNILGYNTYDAIENGWYLHKEWVKVITEGSTADDFRRMYEGVDAVTDLPCYLFWEQLHEAFPDAKIILTVRDEDSWYKSFVKQMDRINSSYFDYFIGLFSPSIVIRRKYNYHIMKFICDAAPFPRKTYKLFSETVMKNLYRQHNTYVQQAALKDKLLVYEVTQGWGPLCEFLGVEIPDEPFPHKNKGAAVMEELIKENKIVQTYIYQAFAMASVCGLVGGFVGYKLYKNTNFDRGFHLLSWHFSMFKN